MELNVDALIEGAIVRAGRITAKLIRGASGKVLWGQSSMDLQFWTGAVVMMLLAPLTASLVIHSGRSAWFVGVLVLMVYLVFAVTLYLPPPGVSADVERVTRAPSGSSAGPRR
jgi:hypothetical protein